AALAVLPSLAGAPVRPGSPVADARQLVVVTTDGWDELHGTLRRYERARRGGSWHAVGEPVRVVVGRSGLGWGTGVHAEAAPEGAPVKREGDGKAPAGAFRLGSAFGYAPRAEVPWIRLPYIHSTESYRCVDDVKSAHYNRVVDSAAVVKDWSGTVERMRLDTDQYRLGVIVEHNWGAQTRPGGGSCIFLHIWKGPDEGTAGCTAMQPADIEALLRWLDPARRPALVQLPEAEYRRLRGAWKLP
ncbi:MAG: L,D-transpeptidase family protein, partial [Gemmatimonadetes bacterium]|nr:L,D-transpeptidase family protein [Gemmatimonadota bacterium]